MAGLMDVALLVPPLVAGMVIGYYLRGKKLPNFGKLVLGIILGFSIGLNSELLGIMPSVGFNALMLLVMALLFSILFVKAARKLVKV